MAGNFFDFPLMGMDQDAYTFTGNIFTDNGSYVTTEVFATVSGALARAVVAAGPLGDYAVELMLSHSPHQFQKRHLERLREANRAR